MSQYSSKPFATVAQVSRNRPISLSMMEIANLPLADRATRGAGGVEIPSHRARP
jgi:hypothetical protein